MNMKTVLLSDTVVARLRTPIGRTWQAIGYDIEPLVGTDNESAIEGCIDCERLMEFGGDREAQQIVENMIAEHGYAAFIQALSRKIHLV